MKKTSVIPIVKFDNSGCPFHVRSMKFIEMKYNEPGEIPHSHDYYEVIWVIKGKGMLHVDLQNISLENNRVCCVRPGQIHSFQGDNSTEGFIFSFTDAFFNVGEHEFEWSCQANLYQIFRGSQVLQITNEMQPDIIDATLKILKEFNSVYPFRTQLLKCYFRIFLVYLTRQQTERLEAFELSREAELSQKFLALLDKNFKEMKMVSDYAVKLFVTPNYLSGVVKRATGYSAGHHIRQRIVLEAKRLGRFSDAAMKEIAYSLGFSDSGHFSKLFKAVSGINFTDFKKESFDIPIFMQLGRTG